MVTQERLTLRNVYLYLVCLITLVVSIFAAVSLVRSTVELLYPDPGYYGSYAPLPGQDGPIVSKREIRRQQEASRDAARRQAVLGLVGSATTLAIAGPVYAYHWRRVQSELPPRAAEPVAAGPPST